MFSILLDRRRRRSRTGALTKLDAVTLAPRPRRAARGDTHRRDRRAHGSPTGIQVCGRDPSTTAGQTRCDRRRPRRRGTSRRTSTLTQTGRRRAQGVVAGIAPRSSSSAAGVLVGSIAEARPAAWSRRRPRGDRARSARIFSPSGMYARYFHVLAGTDKSQQADQNTRFPVADRLRQAAAHAVGDGLALQSSAAPAWHQRDSSASFNLVPLLPVRRRAHRDRDVRVGRRRRSRAAGSRSTTAS